jgi:hypothetical protein
MLSSSRTSARRCTAAARHTRQPLKVGAVRVPTHGGRHGIRSTRHALFTSTFGGIIMHPRGEPPNTSASSLCRSPCRRAVLLLHRIVLGIRARLDPSMPGHGRDEPRRREVRAETLDLVREWAEPRRRGPARRLGASHAAVAAGVPRRSLALAPLLDTVASVPLNHLNRGAKMRKCLRCQKLKTTFPADDRFPTDSGPVCWTCHQRQEATPDEVRVFRLRRRRAVPHAVMNL